LPVVKETAGRPKCRSHKQAVAAFQFWLFYSFDLLKL
jgi:hypothetical protein